MNEERTSPCVLQSQLNSSAIVIMATGMLMRSM